MLDFFFIKYKKITRCTCRNISYLDAARKMRWSDFVNTA